MVPRLALCDCCPRIAGHSAPFPARTHPNCQGRKDEQQKEGKGRFWVLQHIILQIWYARGILDPKDYYKYFSESPHSCFGCRTRAA